MVKNVTHQSESIYHHKNMSLTEKV